jgi:phospholipid-transporting ATPase
MGNKILVALGLEKPDLTHTFVPQGTRTILIGQNNHCLHNSVSTGKYSLVTFLPKFIIEFFSSYANLFFLFTGSIQLYGDLSPGSKFGTALPLGVIFLMQMAKELVEDSKRHRMDLSVNNRPTKVLRNRQFIEVLWKDVQVGDVIRIENGQYFPADIILLSSSEPDALCYIETANLDGETNLKIRQGLPETSHILTPELVASLQGSIKSELPNNSLYTFEALLQWDGKEVPLSPQQLLLRGAQLRNTKWIYGVVVFTGHETKLMMNSSATPSKKTKVEHMVNSQIIFLFFLLLTIAVSCAFGQLYTELNSRFISDIMLRNINLQTAYFPDFFPKNILTYMILFNNLIPLSLIVTVEFVKIALGKFINEDLDMYYAENDTPAIARTTSLVEELGQIDYIFSDKTGTLTRNIMEFKMCSIGGRAYAEEVPHDKQISRKEDGTIHGYYDFLQLQRDQPDQKLIQEFLTLLAVCHTVIPEYDDNEELQYQASSPDEAALVDGAKSLGYLFHTRKPRSVTISVHGKDEEYEVLAVNEFNSTRKRMSVIVRDPHGQVKVMIKGADTVIFERLQKGCPYEQQTQQHLEEYAVIGLRTLVLAYRDVSNSEYEKWKIKFDEASATINNRQQALDDCAEEMERDLTLLGATAIEDKLQDGVPETIYTLMEAGIKIWVLTGDRQETAINIGMSCKLIKPDMTMIICNEPDKKSTFEFLNEHLNVLKKALGDRKFESSKWDRFWMGISDKDGKFDKNIGTDLQPLALIIDGKTLDFALAQDVKETFLELAMLCKAVVCCRVSPLQKALVVKLVKQNVGGSVTLAIGDGANDVSMIQAAHVGVGISGQEGLQAARSADFSIAQFRFLRKLLLVHGGWAYSRITKVITISFYKNMTLYLILFWFALNNMFSATSLFETWSQASSYNVAWTLLPPIAIGAFDQYVSARVLDKYPEMYRLGQTDKFYNHKVFLGWVFNALIHATLLFYVWYFIAGEGMFLQDGRTADNWVFGTMIYFSTLLTVMIKHFLISNSVTFLVWFALFGSFLGFCILFPLVFLIHLVHIDWFPLEFIP